MAARGYKPESGFKFQSYAKRAIRNQIGQDARIAANFHEVGGRQQRFTTQGFEDIVSRAPSEKDEEQFEDWRLQLSTLLLELSPLQRQIVTLHGTGLPLKQVAEVVGRPALSVKSLHGLAVRRLKAKVG